MPKQRWAKKKKGDKLEKLPAWQMIKREELQKRSSKRHRKSKEQFVFAALMDICHVKNAELEPKFQKYKGPVVLLGDIVKDDSGSCAGFIEQGSSAAQMTAAKSNGCHSKVTRMCWTSSPRSISLHPSQN